MIRRSISSEYAKLPLEYMHAKLTDLKLPFKDIGKYKTSDVNLVSDKKKHNIMNLDQTTIKSIRSEYFHHSSDLVGIGMDGTTALDESEFYGERTIYES